MGNNNQESGYFCQILKSCITDSDMSLLGRFFGICISLPGAIIVDPVLKLCNMFGVDSEKQDYDPGDPNHPFNQNY